MLKVIRKRSKKVGLSPGTLLYVGMGNLILDLRGNGGGLLSL